MRHSSRVLRRAFTKGALFAAAAALPDSARKASVSGCACNCSLLNAGAASKALTYSGNRAIKLRVRASTESATAGVYAPSLFAYAAEAMTLCVTLHGRRV